jgi:hypothetical protein
MVIANLNEATEIHLEAAPLQGCDFSLFKTFEAQIA